MSQDPEVANGKPIEAKVPPRVGTFLVGLVVVCVAAFIALPLLLGVAVKIFLMVVGD